MTRRRLYVDEGVGETRGVVVLSGRPERLLIARDGASPVQAAAAQAVARIRKIERAQALAFLDLGEGPDAVLNIKPEHGRLTEGLAIEIEIRAESRGDKGAQARFIGLGEGAPRLLRPAPAIVEQLRAFDKDAELVTGHPARSAADEAQEEALQSVFPIPGGGTVAVEPTRALTAVDVDLGDRAGGDAKRVTRQANMAALGVAARALRLKGQGGLVVIDLAGRGHDGAALLSAARAAFGPDNPGVAFGAVSRFGTLELTIPRRARPALDILTDGSGQPSALTEALALVRALEREAEGDPGARLEARAAPDVIAAATPYLSQLEARFGARLALVAQEGRPRAGFEVARS